MNETNPVVLLSGETWHIVESSRGSKVALCGKKIGERRAHSRLRTIGAENVCAACRAIFRQRST